MPQVPLSHELATVIPASRKTSRMLLLIGTTSVAPLLASDDAFFAANGALLRNPSVVNLLDGCALTLPCHAPGSLPVGLMAWAGAMCDDTLLNASLALEAALAPLRGNAC